MSHIANSNIRVDNFQYRQQDKTRYVYFLSHCHEDHLRGLSNNWNHGKIYTSFLSKKLITERFPGIRDFVVDLEMDEEHWIYIDEDRKEGVQVVLMDAFHCPGAVMFLLKGKMGTVLHTGDFRFSEAMFDNEWLCPVEKRNPLFKGITVDVDYLHLDNTFANPEYDFPSREEAYQGLVNIVKSHLEYRVFLFSYSLGKEEVFLNLAEDFKTKIVVDESRKRKIELMDLKPELFTTDPSESRIHIRSIRDLKAHDINECNREEPTIFVILTGWNDKYNKNLPFYFKVPYSSHSNYRELERFVKAVNPGKLIFNVHERNDTKKRAEFQSYLAREYEKKGAAHPTASIVRSQAGQLPDSDRYKLASTISSNFFATGKTTSKHQQAAQRLALQNPSVSIAASIGLPQPTQSSLLHPAVLSNNSKQQPQHLVSNKIKAGYQGAVREISTRFDVNNREMNKRRFNDQYAHIVQASKNRQTKTKASKFRLQEVSLTLTPENDLSAEKHPASALATLQEKVEGDHQGACSVNFDGLEKRDLADMLNLEDSSQSVLASKLSSQNAVAVATLLGDNKNEDSLSSLGSKASNSRKRRFKHLQTAFDGPQKANSVSYKDLKRRKLDQSQQLKAEASLTGAAAKAPSKAIAAEEHKLEPKIPLPQTPQVIGVPDASFLDNLRQQIVQHQAKMLAQCSNPEAARGGSTSKTQATAAGGPTTRSK